MFRFEQFEVWVFRNDRWELIATFFDFDTAHAVAVLRKSQMKLVHATYENGQLVASETIAELGNIRTA